MKRLALLAALLSLNVPHAFAGTAEQRLANTAHRLLENVLRANNDQGARDRFVPKVVNILDKAHCARSGESNVDCSQAAAAQVEEAQGALDDLIDAWKQELAQVSATKALAQKTAAKAQGLRPVIQNVKPASAQAQLLQTFITILNKAKCSVAAASVDCSQAASAQLETASDGLDQLKLDIGQASQQAAATSALALKTAAQAQTLLAAIGNKPASAKAQFQQTFVALLSKADCRMQAGSVDCSQASAGALATAQTDLAALAHDIGQADAQAAATQALALKTAAQAQTLLAAIGNKPASAKAQFQQTFVALLSKADCRMQAGSVDCSQASAGALATAQTDLAALAHDIGQADAQAAATQALAQKTAAQAQTLLAAIGNKPASAKAQFQQTFVAIISKADCRMQAGSVDCSQASAGALATAQTDLAALAHDIGQADAQAAATQALALKTAAQAQTLLAAIGNKPASAKAQFQQTFVALLSKADCRMQAGSVDCSQASAGALATAQTDLAALAHDIGQADAEAAATQALAQKTADRAQGLRPALGAVAPAVTKGQLNQRFSAILIKDNCRMQAGSVDCSQAASGALAAAQTDLDALARDIGLAAQQEAATQAFAQKIFTDAQTLRSAIKQVPSPDAQQQLSGRLSSILNAAKCDLKSGVGCSELPAGTLQAARAALDQLRLDTGASVEASPLDAAPGSPAGSAKFLADSDGVAAQIDVRELPAASVSGFLSRVAKVKADAGCNGPAFTITMVKQTGPGGLPLPARQERRPADPCQNSSPGQLQAGEAALRLIERDYQEQVKSLVDAGLTQLYAARIQDLNAQIDQAKMIPAVSAPPRKMVADFASSLPATKSADVAEQNYNALVAKLDAYLTKYREN